MELTVSQIKSLAPDAASFSAGEKISRQNWSVTGRSERALWGEIFGSGSKPYQVRIDLREFAFRCTCPSHKLPCKHVLGLMLRIASDEKSIPLAEEPAWIVEWLEQRDVRAQKKKEKTENNPQTDDSSAPKDPVKAEQRKKRASQRFDRVKSGLEQYRLWLNDLLRFGLAGLETRPDSFWNEEIKRLIDAQIAPLASQVRNMQDLLGASRNSTERLLVQMGRSALLCEAFQHLAELPEDLQSEVTQLFGWTVNQKELEINGPQITDRWIMVGQTTEQGLNIKTQFNWYWGVESKRFLLYLQFAYGRGGFEELYLIGSQLLGSAVFWPGTEQLRGLFLTKENVLNELGQIARQTFLPEDAARTIPEFLNDIAEQTVRQPWRSKFPALLRRIVVRPPVDENSEDEFKMNWRIIDGAGNTLLMKGQNYWPLTALSAGGSITLFGLWDGSQFQPLSIWRGGFFEAAVTEDLFLDKYSTRSVPNLFEPPVSIGSDQNGKLGAVLLKSALLGTDKMGSLAIKNENESDLPVLRELLQKIRARSDEPSWKLLLEAGLVSLAHQAGFIPPKSNTQKAVFFSNRDPRYILPKQLADVLFQLLEQQTHFASENISPKTINRLLEAAALLKMRLPDEKIPQFLSCFSRIKYFKEAPNAAAQALLGATGQWLGSFGQEWRGLVQIPIRPASVEKNESAENEQAEFREQSELWTEGTFIQRKEILLELRRRFPDQGRCLLEQTWKDEKAEHREAFLAILVENPSDRDIPFLEKAYSDRSSAVRITAIDLLLKLPESLLSKRTVALAESILTGGIPSSECVDSEKNRERRSGSPVKGSSGFEVTPPPDLTKEMKKDGFDLKPPHGIGKQGWLLFQVISKTAPEHWEIFFQRSPEQILMLYRDDVYFSELFCAWCRALKTFGGSVEWFHTLWNISRKKEIKLDKNAIFQNAINDLVLFAVAQTPRILKTVIKDIQEDPSTSSELLGLIWAVLIEKEPFPWSESFAEVFYKFLFKSHEPDAFILKYLPLFPQTLRMKVSQIVFQPNNLFHCTKSAQDKIRNTIGLCRNFDQIINEIRSNR